MKTTSGEAVAAVCDRRTIWEERRSQTAATGALAILFAMAASNVLGLGLDYRNGEPVGGTSSWPDGMKELVNITNRVHGFFVNDEDVFFFSGSATNFTGFLRDYSKIGGTVNEHRLILHEGIGEAKSPWDKTGQPCDWKLSGRGNGWKDGIITNYVLEVHFWTGGRISLDQVAFPQNVEFAGDYLKVFASITNGMTRAEIEKKFAMDGGLQGASPVRFVHPSCPLFKVNLEFDFKRNAADQGRAVIGKDDKVIGVSKPYFERPFMD